MKNKIWFYLFIIQTIILFGVIFVAIWSSLYVPKVRKTDLVEYLDQFTEDNNFIPDAGYIPDARTAKIVGSQIIDKMANHRWFGSVTIEYDEVNRLWKVEKGYFIFQGGFVIIEQDTGKVIKALKSK
jgi:hypothetical protein